MPSDQFDKLIFISDQSTSECPSAQFNNTFHPCSIQKKSQPVAESVSMKEKHWWNFVNVQAQLPMFMNNALSPGFKPESFAKITWLNQSFKHQNVKFVKPATVPTLILQEKKFPNNFFGKMSKNWPLLTLYLLWLQFLFTSSS